MLRQEIMRLRAGVSRDTGTWERPEGGPIGFWTSLPC
jgi:hypothetical protein